MVGTAIARDLARDGHVVTVADADAQALDGFPQHRLLDATKAGAVRAEAAKHDLVVGALPSRLGWSVLHEVIEAGRDYCDVSFMSEDPLGADSLARERGVTVLVDCGVAPGLTNLLVGRAAASLARVQRVAIYVGGLPEVRAWPFEYKAGFSPRDVIEEYVRPVRMVERGRVVEKEALSEIELLELEGVGTLEAFNTDGLRTLLQTIEADELSEKTLRYPGHAELMRVFRHLGLFGSSPVALPRGGRVSPIDLTEALLFPQWRFQPGEADLTVMRVQVDGTVATGSVTWRWEMLDRYDEATDTRSMSRVTGYTCTALARLVLDGRWRRPGVTPPELLGRDPVLVDAVLADLRLRGIVVLEHPR